MATVSHKGHRERMRERIKNNGILSLQEHEILEYLLYSFIPRKDTNPIAHQLISKFGSLKNVFDSTPEMLMEVEGMTQNAALFLSVLPEAMRAYFCTGTSQKRETFTRGVAKNYFGAKFYELPVERMYCALLDAHEKLIACDMLGEGSANQVEIPVRKVVDYALRHNASMVILAHNHPSGVVYPSLQDDEVTAQIYVALESLGIKLLDHLIFGSDKYFSYDETKKLGNMASLTQLIKINSHSDAKKDL